MRMLPPSGVPPSVFPLPVLHGRVSLTDVVADTIPDSPVKKVAKVKRHPSFRSCQFSYPLSFRGQVCETQCSLPCCPSTVLSTWHPSFLDRVPVSRRSKAGVRKTPALCEVTDTSISHPWLVWAVLGR